MILAFGLVGLLCIARLGQAWTHLLNTREPSQRHYLPMFATVLAMAAWIPLYTQVLLPLLGVRIPN